jgi:hypothetical protein
MYDKSGKAIWHPEGGFLDDLFAHKATVVSYAKKQRAEGQKGQSEEEG